MNLPFDRDKIPNKDIKERERNLELKRYGKKYLFYYTFLIVFIHSSKTNLSSLLISLGMIMNCFRDISYRYCSEWIHSDIEKQKATIHGI